VTPHVVVVVIVGAGLAGDDVILIGEEPDRPYERK
jgi:hypothetical protein